MCVCTSVPEPKFIREKPRIAEIPSGSAGALSRAPYITADEINSLYLLSDNSSIPFVSIEFYFVRFLQYFQNNLHVTKGSKEC